MRSPIFIVGMPRSGTTLLGSMLDAHSEIAVAPETHFYTRCRSADALDRDAVDDVWACLQEQPGVQDMQLIDEEKKRVWDRVHRVEEPDPADLLTALGTTYAERSGASTWGENTPDHLAYVPTILEEFPGALVLCIVRDPRDVCLSLQSVPWNRDSLPEATWTWRRYAAMSDRYQAAFPERFHELRYEDLLSRPQAVLRSVAEDTGIGFEESMLAFHRRDRGPADPTREPWKAKTQQPLDSSNTEKWRDRMPEAERAVIQRLAGSMLEKKGYSRAPITIDGAFLKGVLRVVLRTIRTVGGRWWSRWRRPRSMDSHTPVWMQERGGGAEEEEVSD